MGKKVGKYYKPIENKSIKIVEPKIAQYIFRNGDDYILFDFIGCKNKEQIFKVHSISDPNLLLKLSDSGFIKRTSYHPPVVSSGCNFEVYTNEMEQFLKDLEDWQNDTYTKEIS